MGEVGRCGTCKHWFSEPGDTPGRRVCTKIDYDNSIEVADSYDKAVVRVLCGYEEASGVFETAADFGCVLHEPCEENHVGG